MRELPTITVTDYVTGEPVIKTLNPGIIVDLSTLEGVIVEPDYTTDTNGCLLDYEKGSEELRVYFDPEGDDKTAIVFVAGDPFERGAATIPLEAAVAMAQAILAAAAELNS